jgi:hypothetical protein
MRGRSRFDRLDRFGTGAQDSVRKRGPRLVRHRLAEQSPSRREKRLALGFRRSFPTATLRRLGFCSAARGDERHDQFDTQAKHPRTPCRNGQSLSDAQERDERRRETAVNRTTTIATATAERRKRVRDACRARHRACGSGGTDSASESTSSLYGDAMARAVKEVLEPRAAYLALVTEIKSFDDADTRKLISLMYSGREQESLRTTHRRLGHDEPDHERSQILSKRGSALPEYLRRALEQARDAKIDLDAPLPDDGLLRALSNAGTSDEVLDHWDPQYLGLYKISGGLSADPEVASRLARTRSAGILRWTSVTPLSRSASTRARYSSSISSRTRSALARTAVASSAGRSTRCESLAR